MLKCLHKIQRTKNKKLKTILDDSSRTKLDRIIPSSHSTINTKVDYSKILNFFSKSNMLSFPIISNTTTINQTTKTFWFNEKYDATLIQILEKNPKSSLPIILLLFYQFFSTNITLLQLKKYLLYLRNNMQKR